MQGALPATAAFEESGLSAARNAAQTEARAQPALPAPVSATPEQRVLPAAPAPAVGLQQREWQENSSSRKSDTTGIATGISLTADSVRSESAGLRPDAPASAVQLSGEVARQIFQAHNRNLSHLRMQLNPEELGQLDLRMRVDGDRVHVAIVAQHAVARDLLESQLPQLRALLQEGGFELGDVDVRHQGGGGRDGYSPDSQPGQTTTTGQLAADTAAGADAAANPTNDSQARLIDAFA
jgi:flagellar hook-length control protein FliK